MKDMLGSLPPEVLRILISLNVFYILCIVTFSLFKSVIYFKAYIFFLAKIMQALVEHYSMKGWLQRIEQCVLHMDISSLDFNQVFSICKIFVYYWL